MRSCILLDRRIAKQFHECAKHTNEYPNNCGEMKRLRIELQKLCGITELEAVNILINRNVTDYISKYNGEIGGCFIEITETGNDLTGDYGYGRDPIIAFEALDM